MVRYKGRVIKPLGRKYSWMARTGMGQIRSLDLAGDVNFGQEDIIGKAPRDMLWKKVTFEIVPAGPRGSGKARRATNVKFAK